MVATAIHSVTMVLFYYYYMLPPPPQKNGISIGLSGFAGLSVVTNILTDNRQLDQAARPRYCVYSNRPHLYTMQYACDAA